VLQGLGFAMLKRTGKGGMAPFKGSGFVTGRTVNARRETEWSAPTYFDMTIYGLGPPFRGDSTYHANTGVWYRDWARAVTQNPRNHHHALSMRARKLAVEFRPSMLRYTPPLCGEAVTDDNVNTAIHIEAASALSTDAVFTRSEAASPPQVRSVYWTWSVHTPSRNCACAHVLT